MVSVDRHCRRAHHGAPDSGLTSRFAQLEDEMDRELNAYEAAHGI